MPVRTALLAAALLAAPALADDTKETVARQKQKAVDNLQKMGVTKPAVQETADLFVCGQLAPDKARQLGDAIQKQYAAAYKALKFEANDLPWKGKLAVYTFLERGQFTAFVRQVEQRRPESDETSSADVRSDDPHVAVAVNKGESIAAMESAASNRVVIALLTRRAGVAELPAWFKDAFARAVRMRSDPKAAAERSAARRLLTGPRGRYVKPTDGWGTGDASEKEVIATSVVDYLVFGPESGKFATVLSGFRQSEENPQPNVDSALKSAGFTPEGLEKGWKSWVQKGR